MNEFFIAIGCCTTFLVGSSVLIILISELEDDLAHRRELE